MDAELQGTLSACSSPHIHVADSLQMAERAVQMAERGARAIVVLGVDFMSENVRATLDAAGHAARAGVPGRERGDRLLARRVGRGAAPTARTSTQAARTPRSLHVIYVNTSLRIKAHAERLLPTITCTSSNVLPLMLQAFAQVPDLHVWFGPDTYMGENLARMLTALSRMPAERVAQLHPAAHAREPRRGARALRALRAGPVRRAPHVRRARWPSRCSSDYADAFVTAHLEVPGEMFALGCEAAQAGPRRGRLDLEHPRLHRAQGRRGGRQGARPRSCASCSAPRPA